MKALFGFNMENVRNVMFGRDIKAEDKPLKKVAEAFRDLAANIDSNGEGPPMNVAAFSDACALVNVLVGCIGVAFRIAEQELDSKVTDIAEASKTIRTLPEMIDADMKTNTVKIVGSHARNLLRVNRGIDFVKVIFEELLAREGEDSMVSPATKAYEQVFGAYHSAAIQNIVMYTALPLTPTKSELIAMVHENDESAKIHMKTYVAASEKVIKYVNRLFDSRGLGIDW